MAQNSTAACRRVTIQKQCITRTYFCCCPGQNIGNWWCVYHNLYSCHTIATINRVVCGVSYSVCTCPSNPRAKTTRGVDSRSRPSSTNWRTRQINMRIVGTKWSNRIDMWVWCVDHQNHSRGNNRIKIAIN